MTTMNFPVTMEDVCQIITIVMTLMTVKITVMKRDVVRDNHNQKNVLVIFGGNKPTN